MRKNLPVLLAALVALNPGIVLAGKLYRWVDADGQVHYTDKIPPSHAGQGHAELSSKGIRVQTVPPAKTPEEIRREQELARLKAEQQRLIEEQRAQDRVLLRTFRSEDDIVLARDRKLASIDAVVQVILGNVRRLKLRLGDLQHRAASLERTGRRVPKRLLNSIEGIRRSIEDAYASIVVRENSKEAIHADFDRDLRRFRILKNLRPARTEDSTPAPRPELENLIDCPDTGCATAWKRAKAFVRRHATTPIQLLGDNIIMTEPARTDRDISLAVSRIRDNDRGTVLFMDLQCKGSPLGRAFCDGEHVQHVRQAFREEVQPAATTGEGDE